MKNTEENLIIYTNRFNELLRYIPGRQNVIPRSISWARTRGCPAGLRLLLANAELFPGTYITGI